MNAIVLTCSHCGQKNRVPAAKQHLRPRCGKCREIVPVRPEEVVPIVLDDATFPAFVANASLPLLVEFYSPTCGHCQRLIPVINSLAGRYFQRLLVAIFDTSRSSAIPTQFQIRGVPTLIFFQGGQKVERFDGAVAESVLVQAAERLIVKR